MARTMSPIIPLPPLQLTLSPDVITTFPDLILGCMLLENIAHYHTPEEQSVTAVEIIGVPHERRKILSNGITTLHESISFTVITLLLATLMGMSWDATWRRKLLAAGIYGLSFLWIMHYVSRSIGADESGAWRLLHVTMFTVPGIALALTEHKLTDLAMRLDALIKNRRQVAKDDVRLAKDWLVQHRREQLADEDSHAAQADRSIFIGLSKAQHIHMQRVSENHRITTHPASSETMKLRANFARRQAERDAESIANLLKQYGKASMLALVFAGGLMPTGGTTDAVAKSADELTDSPRKGGQG